MNRKVKLVGLVTTALLVLACGIFTAWLFTAPPMPNSLDESIDTFRSLRFAVLDTQQRERYFLRSRELFEAASPEDKRLAADRVRDDPELRRAVQEAMEVNMTSMARDFMMADAVKKRQIIDQIIGMQQMSEGGMGRPNRPPGSSGPGGGQPDTSPEAQARRDERRAEFRKHMQDRVEQGNPQRQAYMMEFFKAMAERREQLGLEPMPQPRRRG